MPSHIKTIYITLLKNKMTARDFLSGEMLQRKVWADLRSSFIYKSHVASWLSEYVL